VTGRAGRPVCSAVRYLIHKAEASSKHLPLDQSGVYSIGVLNQVHMSTLLDDRATVDDNDAIGTLYCAQSVCNNDHSAIFQVGIDRLLNLSTVTVWYTLGVYVLHQVLSYTSTSFKRKH